MERITVGVKGLFGGFLKDGMDIGVCVCMCEVERN